jgi:hypothetical protein
MTVNQLDDVFKHPALGPTDYQMETLLLASAIAPRLEKALKAPDEALKVLSGL